MSLHLFFECSFIFCLQYMRFIWFWIIYLLFIVFIWEQIITIKRINKLKRNICRKRGRNVFSMRLTLLFILEYFHRNSLRIWYPNYSTHLKMILLILFIYLFVLFIHHFDNYIPPTQDQMLLKFSYSIRRERTTDETKKDKIIHFFTLFVDIEHTYWTPHKINHFIGYIRLNS